MECMVNVHILVNISLIFEIMLAFVWVGNGQKLQGNVAYYFKASVFLLGPRI